MNGKKIRWKYFNDKHKSNPVYNAGNYSRYCCTLKTVSGLTGYVIPTKMYPGPVF